MAMTHLPRLRLLSTTRLRSLSYRSPHVLRVALSLRLAVLPMRRCAIAFAGSDGVLAMMGGVMRRIAMVVVVVIAARTGGAETGVGSVAAVLVEVDEGVGARDPVGVGGLYVVLGAAGAGGASRWRWWRRRVWH